MAERRRVHAEGEPQGPPHEDPEHPGRPPGDPEHPEHPHGAPPGQEDDNGEEEEEHPAHPIVEPQAPAPVAYGEPQPEAIFVEPLLGLGEYVSVAGLGTPAAAALKRWLRLKRRDFNGHYTLAQWQDAEAQMMVYTGD